MAVWDDMFSKITARYGFQVQESIPEYRPAENIDSHGCQITLGNKRLLLKFQDPAPFLRYHDSKTAGLLHRHRHGGYCDIRLICLVEIQHKLIIHLINMVSGEDQYKFWMIVLYIFQILINGIGSSRIPFAVPDLFIWRKNGYAADVAVQIPWDTDADMRIQPEGLVLC